MLLRHRKLFRGISQPALDYFSTACMADILREKKPGLALIHLTAYDSLCHMHGKDSGDLTTAYESLDKNLALLLEAGGNDREIIVFSDHSQINVHTVLDPNEILADMGHIIREDRRYHLGGYNCYIECCGGSAFFHEGNLPAYLCDEIRIAVKESTGFRRFLTAGEMEESGRTGAAFGFCAHAGYCYEAFAPEKKANHGYPLDMPDYSVFYMVKGAGLKPCVTYGGSLLDIAPLVSRRIGLSMFKEG